MEEPNIILLRVYQNYLKRERMQQSFTHFLLVLQEEGARFSDVLRGIADYAQKESLKRDEESESYSAIALLLSEAARVAEVRGREIP